VGLVCPLIPCTRGRRAGDEGVCINLPPISDAPNLNLLIELQRTLKLTYLLITHDLTVVRYMCDEVALMYLGKIVEQGSVQQIFAQPKHPYTQALMHDIPSTNPDQRMLEQLSLEADIISAPWLGRGCRFSPRCPAAPPRKSANAGL
jgi:peptide/nickel transport system ATP-binding protein